MTEELPVQITELAAEEIREVDNWWQENRVSAPGAVRDELERALALISLQPRIWS